MFLQRKYLSAADTRCKSCGIKYFNKGGKGACRYDVCKIFGIFDPLPLVCILDQFIVLNSRHLPYCICFWGTPHSHCRHHMYMPPKLVGILARVSHSPEFLVRGSSTVPEKLSIIFNFRHFNSFQYYSTINSGNHIIEMLE